MITGENLIGGHWVASENSFASQPSTGPTHDISIGSEQDVDRAVTSAEAAFPEYGRTRREDRAAFLDRCADEIEARAAEITTTGCQETGLPEARLEGERARTTGQLRLFAEHIRKGDYLDHRVDEALPERAPLPRPELRLVQRPIGPVVVFGASNFPLAFSTAGGDTASALAAGCPVIVKGHPAHPGTAEIVARAIVAARKRTGLPEGVFSLIQDNGVTVGQALVQHPLIRAVGFTGSLQGGRALYDLCAARPEPIPFFGELGSVNPMFLLPGALAARAETIAEGWVVSLTMGAGQFCTNPGVVFVPDGEDGDRFVRKAAELLSETAAQTMLTDAIAGAHRLGRARLAAIPGVEQRFGSEDSGRTALPSLFETSVATWRDRPELGEEVFGPVGIAVRVTGPEDMSDLAKDLRGQLTATLHLEDEDIGAAQELLPILERKAGRVLANGFPTGVELADAMVHSGPYPASTNFGATSVGTMAIRRWLRPVCYQNIPKALMDPDLAM